MNFLSVSAGRENRPYNGVGKYGKKYEEVGMSEKFILTVRAGLHLGHIKETFGAGAVIEVDEVNKRLIVDGRKFDDTRDIDILKRQAVKFPNNPWIVPFSEEMLEEIRGSKPVASPPPKPRPGEHMQIIKSDSDLTEPIDIKDTQISKRNNEVKEAARNKVKTEGMPIIRGDETVEERLAALKDKTDINSMAERVRLKQQAARMPVVQDDSLGSGVSKTAVPLNAGQALPSRESVEAKSEEARAMADARKKEVEMKRKASGIDVPSENAPMQAKEMPVQTATPTPEKGEAAVGIEMGENDTDASKEVEITTLKARIAALEAEAKKPMAERRPVTSPERAKEILGNK